MFWAFLAVVVAIVLLFFVIPALFPKTPIKPLAITGIAPVPALVPTPKPAKPSPAKVARAQLNKQFWDTQATAVEEDYPQKKIGACPFTKPYSTDLPIPDIPICIIKNDALMPGMRLDVPTAPKPC